MDKLNRIMAALEPDGPPPTDAVVLRGYLASSEDPKLHALRAKQQAIVDADPPDDDAKAQAEEILALLAAELGSVDDAARIYLSARFDRYVDFDWSKDLIVAFPANGADRTTEDFSTTVWLRFRPDTPYVVVTRTPLTPEQRFVRGQLLEDFMEQPEAQTVWDEQTYSPLAARPSRTYCTA